MQELHGISWNFICTSKSNTPVQKKQLWLDVFDSRPGKFARLFESIWHTEPVKLQHEQELMAEILRWRIQRSSMVPWRSCSPLSKKSQWSERLCGHEDRCEANPTQCSICRKLCLISNAGQSPRIGGIRSGDWVVVCATELFGRHVSNNHVFLEDGPVCYVNGQSDVDFVVDMRSLSCTTV